MTSSRRSGSSPVGVRRARAWRRQATAWGALAVALLVGPATHAAPPTAPRAEAVAAALAILADHHVDSPDPARLLDAAVRGLWRALAELGPEAVPTDPEPPRTLDHFVRAFGRAVEAARGRIGEPELEQAALAAMAESLGDSHTRFYPPDRAAALRERLVGRAAYVGIGAIPVVVDGRYYLWDVFGGGPAARAGLRPFDRVLTVDGGSLDAVPEADAVERVRGPAGTPVDLTVRRPGRAAPLAITVVREPVPEPAVQLASPEPGIGYVRLLAFPTGTAARLRATLEALGRWGLRALVLDLRHNGGGLLRELERVADLLLPPGSVVYVEHTRGGVRAHRSAGDRWLAPALPLVVLVDDRTESSAEALAAALQDAARAAVVGRLTAGAMQRTRFFALPGGGTLGVPTARVFRPRGIDLEGTGVTPDVPVELSAAELDRGVDAQLARALGLARQRAGVPPLSLPRDPSPK